MLEDINCLLGSGEVPSLFSADEEAGLVDSVRDAVRATGKPDTQVSNIDIPPWLLCTLVYLERLAADPLV